MPARFRVILGVRLRSEQTDNELRVRMFGAAPLSSVIDLKQLLDYLSAGFGSLLNQSVLPASA